ncbi:methionine synthase [Methanobacterium aggregans]|uniref:methionine synthase n=1 Tax=Methanobacterium aggregans TaxID=1615586 RepID=UPI001AEB8AF1|nr:methionine synthase [Methanobacterium aggregans]MBP2045542.1 5-methyltetrahydropteroyltriglutamate--homocysteine methyltransferase [Methanobacterium aggregans]
MLTTVVGSYPALPEEPSSLSQKLSSFFGTYDRYKPAIELAVRDQIEAGIDIISDGQVRDGMVEIFAKAIPGMTVEGNTPKIVGKIKPSPVSISAEDLKYAVKIAEGISKEYSSNPCKIEEGVKGVKGIITGPSTLVFSSLLEGFYKSKDKAVIDLAYALKKEAEFLERTGAVYIQIDEPFLSTGLPDIKTAKKAIEIITKDLKVPTAMHVCGDISDVFEELLTFPVDIVDCEFAGIPKNINVLEEAANKGLIKDKKIGFGCIDTKKKEVEDPKKVLELIKKGLEALGKDNLIIDPDCGMKMLPKEAAFSKLKAMTEAVGWLS